MQVPTLPNLSQHANFQKVVDSSRSRSKLLNDADMHEQLTANRQPLLSHRDAIKHNHRSIVTLRSKSNGETIELRGSPVCYHIWYVSDGDIYTDWTDLPNGTEVHATVTALYERRKFLEYLSFIEAIIKNIWCKQQNKTIRTKVSKTMITPRAATFRQSQHKTDETKRTDTNVIESAKNISAKQNQEKFYSQEIISFWWEKLVLTANAMGIMMTEKKKIEIAYEIFDKAMEWARNDQLCSKIKCKRMLSFILEGFAYYYFVRGKTMAAMDYIKRAMATHTEFNDYENIGASLLHLAAIDNQMCDFRNAHKKLYQFLSFILDGRLGLKTATSSQLCLIAVAYHNLAVTQLKLQAPDLACKSSQNSRRIARLCLSHSNRWLSTLQRTHEIAFDDVKAQLSKIKHINASQRRVIQELAQTLYDPAPAFYR
jgi:tetratricopeptide (TPR) repeat protein